MKAHRTLGSQQQRSSMASHRGLGCKPAHSRPNGIAGCLLRAKLLTALHAVLRMLALAQLCHCRLQPLHQKLHGWAQRRHCQVQLQRSEILPPLEPLHPPAALLLPPLLSYERQQPPLLAAAAAAWWSQPGCDHLAAARGGSQSRWQSAPCGGRRSVAARPPPLELPPSAKWATCMHRASHAATKSEDVVTSFGVCQGTPLSVTGCQLSCLQHAADRFL